MTDPLAQVNVEYGLQVQDFGTITGPWGMKEDASNG